jgi:hypothetical protein
MSKPRVPPQPDYQPPPRPDPVMGRDLARVEQERRLAYARLHADHLTTGPDYAAIADHVHATYGTKE